MFSMAEIASLNTSRGSVLIGPLASFGKDSRDIVLRYPDEIRRAVDRLFQEFPDGAMVRALLRRWGLDPNVAARSDRTFLPRWLTDQAVNGAIGIAEASDPILAFAAYSDAQEEVQKAVAAAWARKNEVRAPMARPSAAPAIPNSGLLQIALEERFVMVLSIVETLLSGESLRQFQNIDPIRLASGLLIWIGTEFEDGLELSVLAFDLPYLTDEIIGAIWDISDAIDDTAQARNEPQLKQVAAELAAPIRILLYEEILSRFIRATRITHGRQEHTGRVKKPSLKKKEVRRVERVLEPQPELKRELSQTPECARLARQATAEDAVMDRALLAQAVYNDEHRNVPTGWSPVNDPNELKKLGLIDDQGRSLLKIPDSDFHAEVFKRGEKYVISYKGTESLEDWMENFRQGTGQESKYYTRAIRIAQRATEKAPGKVEFVGHSLGGGMASAAASVTGAPATTFNSAALNEKTPYVCIEGVPPIDPHVVDGDMLTGLIDKTFGLMGRPSPDRKTIAPASGYQMGDVQFGLLIAALVGPIAAVPAAMLSKAKRLHSMESMKAALRKQRSTLTEAQRKAGCV